MNNSTKTRANTKTNKPAPRTRTRRVPRVLLIKVTTWQNIGRFLASRSRDIALITIVLGAFVAVFEGALYSAHEFGFSGRSAYAFAIMPDALMVICAAKQRQVSITAAQWAMAHKWMQFAFRFSLVTNMIAAAMHNAPLAWKHTPAWGFALFAGAVLYHGIVVMFLKGAVDVLTKVRADRNSKAPKPSEVLVPVPAVNAGTASWGDTILANLNALVKPMGRKA